MLSSSGQWRKRLRLVVVVQMWLALMAVPNASAFAVSLAPVPFTLWPGQAMQNGPFSFQYQNGGNLVLYWNSEALWASNTAYTSPGKYVAQTDGNLFIYNASNVPIWATGTKPNMLNGDVEMQSDGNYVEYNTTGLPVWSTKTWHPQSPHSSGWTNGSGFYIRYSASMNATARAGARGPPHFPTRAN